MPYTNPWNETLPSGGAQASTIDDITRALKLDIRERMDTILAVGGKWTNDPIVLDTTGIGIVNNRVIYFGSEDVVMVQDEDDVTHNWGGLGYFNTNEAGKVSLRGLKFPKGVTITRMEIITRVLTGTGITFKLYKRLFQAADTITLINTQSTVTVGTTVIVDTGAAGVNETVEDAIYWIENQPSGGVYRIYGYRFTVNIPGVGSMV